jgi:GMP synthase (glutamine-hydrolysing)
VSTPRLLVVQHENDCPPGWVGEWLVDVGAEIDVRHPYRGDSLPDDLEDFAGMVVLGGSMGANDDAAYPWLTEVKQLMRLAATDHVPTLGICLGHQLCAAAFGGRVEVNPAGQQIGILDVGWTSAATDDALVGPLAGPVRAVQWNNDIVTELPPGAVVLAQTPDSVVQAARFAPTVWGVQWHPETGADILQAWADDDRDEAVERGVDVDAYVAQVAEATPELRASWQPLAHSFVALTGRAERLGA